MAVVVRAVVWLLVSALICVAESPSTCLVDSADTPALLRMAIFDGDRLAIWRDDRLATEVAVKDLSARADRPLSCVCVRDEI